MKKLITIILLLASIGASAQFTTWGTGAIQRQISGSDTTYRWVGSSVGNYLYGKSLSWYLSNLSPNLTFSNGLTRTGNNVALGGDYTGTIIVGDGSTKPSFRLSSLFSAIHNPVTGAIVGFDATSTGIGFGLNSISVGASALTVIDNQSSKGLVNGADYSANFTNESLVTKRWSDARFAPSSGSGNYIQNQNASAQTANSWITGQYKSGTATDYSILQPDGMYSISTTNLGYYGSSNATIQNSAATVKLQLFKDNYRFVNNGFDLEIFAPTLTAGRLQTFQNATGTVALVETSTATVATIADLQAYSGSATTVIVSEHFRGGVFNYDNTGTYSTDGGRYFVATGKGGGMWIRDVSNSQGNHVKWYGAKGDWNLITNTGTDDRAAILACITSNANSNTPVIFDYGVYGVSDSLVVGEGTYLKGLSTLFPKQYFGDGSISIDYKNMTAVKFYNNTNGFVTTLAIVNYRSQGLKTEGLGIFGSGKANNKTGYLLRQTANSTLSVKTTGLVTMQDVYFSDWGIGANGTNSTDTWYLERCHFSDVKVGHIGGSGQTFSYFTDYFKIDSIGAVGNSVSEPDQFIGGEFETRYSNTAALRINGRAIITNSQFITNKKSIVFTSTASNSIVSNNFFHLNSDDDISITTAKDININGNTHVADYNTNTSYNYAFVLEPLNATRRAVNATATRLQLSNNTYIMDVATATSPVLVDASVMATPTGNRFQAYPLNNEAQISTSGGTTITDAYDMGARTVNGALTINSTTNTRNILPSTDVTYSIGSASLQYTNGYFTRLASKSGTAMTIGTEGANSFNFMTGGTNRARFDGSGNLIPLANSTYNFGGAGATWLNGFFTDIQLTKTGILKGNGAGANISVANGSDLLSLTEIIDATTTAYTSTTLNSTYGSVPVMYKVWCRNISGGGMVYIKQTEAGSSDVWVSSAITIVP